MSKIKQNCIIPSAVFTLAREQIQYYTKLDKKPVAGDLVYGEVCGLGQHLTLESRLGRIHSVHAGTRAVFVLGNRYAPDYYEGLVPEVLESELDLLARSGVAGIVKEKNGMISNPTRLKVLGYVCDAEGRVMNTRDSVLLTSQMAYPPGPRAKMILCIGTSMNSGKSYAAAACCYALSSMGRDVRAAKITGTASLKDILLMEDCGASHIADFTYLGHPSTYMLNAPELCHIFKTIDLKYANDPEQYWVVEFADGILQRETRMLLHMPDIRARVHKTVFCAQDAFGAYAGLQILKDHFDWVPDAISGKCSSSPLALRELRELTDIPILLSAERSFKKICELIA
jgi:hypothetical protein